MSILMAAVQQADIPWKPMAMGSDAKRKTLQCEEAVLLYICDSFQPK